MLTFIIDVNRPKMDVIMSIIFPYLICICLPSIYVIVLKYFISFELLILQFHKYGLGIKFELFLCLF